MSNWKDKVKKVAHNILEADKKIEDWEENIAIKDKNLELCNVFWKHLTHSILSFDHCCMNESDSPSTRLQCQETYSVVLHHFSVIR